MYRETLYFGFIDIETNLVYTLHFNIPTEETSIETISADEVLF